MNAPRLLASSILVVLALTAACQDIRKANRAPIATIQVERDGERVVTTRPIEFTGEPITFTLDGRESQDPDGEIAEYLWRRSDVPARVRYPDSGPPDEEDGGAAANLPMGVGPYEGDPEPEREVEVTLPRAGRYKYSLYVTDNDGAVSKPATVTLTLAPPLPAAGAASMP